jgi:hypothetical protein
MRFRILPVLLVSAALFAQQATSKPQKSAPPVKQSGQQSQNDLVGCLSQQGPNMVLMQPRQRRWYRLNGDQAQLQKNVGKLVKLSGELVLGQTSAFNVRQVQVLQEKCALEATSSALPATGKTGMRGDAEPVTTTATAERTTPGDQTARGIAQNPAKAGHGTTLPPRPTASQGAPQNPNVENPAEAQRIANAAQQAELSNQSQLGVNAQPNYSNANNPQANAQAVANTAQQERGQASGSDQVFKGGEKQAPAAQNSKSAQNAQGSAPVVTGCLSQDGNQFWVAEQNGERLRVEGDAAKLKDHVNHKVQIVGNKTGTYGPAVGTSGNTETFHVQAIQDISPTCR